MFISGSFFPIDSRLGFPLNLFSLFDIIVFYILFFINFAKNGLIVLMFYCYFIKQLCNFNYFNHTINLNLYKCSNSLLIEIEHQFNINKRNIVRE